MRKFLLTSAVVLAVTSIPSLSFAQAVSIESAEKTVDSFMIDAFEGMKVGTFGAACPAPGIIAAKFVTGEIGLDDAKRAMIPAILRDKSTMMAEVMSGGTISESYQITLRKKEVVTQAELDELIKFAISYIQEN